jgi:hypothetical protein
VKGGLHTTEAKCFMIESIIRYIENHPIVSSCVAIFIVSIVLYLVMFFTYRYSKGFQTQNCILKWAHAHNQSTALSFVYKIEIGHRGTTLTPIFPPDNNRPHGGETTKIEKADSLTGVVPSENDG